MVVSVSVAIHLINQFLDEIEAGTRGAEAVENTVMHVGMACFLTSLTTALGFFSLMASPVPAVRDFAFCAGLGVLLSFVATMIWVPIALRQSWGVTPARLIQLKASTIERLLDRLVLWLAGHRGKIVWGSALVLIVTLPGMWQLTEGTDIVRALRKHAPLRVSTEFIDQHLTGVNALEFVVQMPNAASLDTPATIRHLLRFSAWLRTQPGVTAVNSAWEPLRGIRADFLRQDDALSTLATLLRGAFPMMHAWLNADQKLLRVSARVNAMRSDHLLALAQRVEQHARQEALSLQTTGSAYLLARMSRTLVRTQMHTLGLAALLVLGSITLALRSWKLGCLAAIPNVLPILLTFGLMGWWGIDLSTATTMIASVALGLIVDDTIHLLYRYGRERQAGLAPLPAVEQSLRRTGRAIISTTVILTLGFWIGILGSFRPTIEFSFLTGLTLLLALLSDLLVTPTALLAWER
jgi:predicted RND superfamily exporter protein